MKIIKYLCMVLILLNVISTNVYASTDNVINDAIKDMDTSKLDEYMKKNSKYFENKNISIADIVKKAIKGELNIDIMDFIKYQIKEQKDFFSDILFTVVNILIVCILLTVINYFTGDIGKDSVSQIVVFFSVIIVFIMATKDINFMKDTLKSEYLKFDDITRNVNGLFMAAMVTLGKIGFLQFFQTYSNYIIGLTTKIIYNFTDIATVVLTVLVLINNISDLVDAKLLYKFLKKAVLVIMTIYIAVVVINFSVQGYILYKADNVFINSIKSLSPSSIPLVGNTVDNFFGLFLSSVSLIKDAIGFVVILFIFSIFGGSLIRLFIIFILYRLVAAFAEPFSKKISGLLQELSDIMYIYMACLATPIIIITIYYSITINFLNNIFS